MPQSDWAAVHQIAVDLLTYYYSDRAVRKLSGELFTIANRHRDEFGPYDD
jgi:hypothetical protein